MQYFTKRTLDFLELASRQKKKDWLDRNRAQYEDLLVEPLKLLVQTVARELRAEAPGYRFPTQVARIRRTEDRARDHGWYKDWIGLQASRDSGSRYESLPNLYFHISDEDILSAGGLYMPSARQVKQIRAWIAHDPTELDLLLEDQVFKRHFAELGDERKLKTKPRDYSEDHPRIEMLRLTGFYVWKPYSRRDFYSRGFAAKLAADWRQVLRLNAVLDSYTAAWPKRARLEDLGEVRAPAAQW